MLGEYKEEAGEALLTRWIVVFAEGHQECQAEHRQHREWHMCRNPILSTSTEPNVLQCRRLFPSFRSLTLLEILIWPHFTNLGSNFSLLLNLPVALGELQFFHHTKISLPGMISFSMMGYKLFLRLFAFYICQV